MKRFACIGLFLGAVWAASVGPQDNLAVHEWGTFTSVAGAGGESIAWQPLADRTDLPCFVERLGLANIKFSMAQVRMETPVIYFYTPRPMPVSVRVNFPEGMITEWYPRATRPPLQPQFGMTMQWDADLLPDAQSGFPVENHPSRYYAARDTDAAPLRAAGQHEKLIFYRGIGNFPIPLQPVVTGQGRLAIGVAGGQNIPAAIVFANRKGKLGYRRIDSLQQSVTVDRPALTGQVETLRHEIEDILVSRGLYPKEAHAMLETWRDSWFEEGMRVLYIVPRGMVDAVLPLAVNPAPQALERVFVGRIEVLSPEIEQEIAQALKADDARPLEKYGRFLQPFLGQVERTAGHPGPAVRRFLNASYDRVLKQRDQACRE